MVSQYIDRISRNDIVRGPFWVLTQFDQAGIEPTIRAAQFSSNAIGAFKARFMYALSYC